MVACYNLAGTPSPFDGKTHVPCNMTAVDAGGHSTCCAIGEYCLTNGMCKNPKDPENSNWYSRKACTDKTWQDPACPRYCEGIEPARNTGLIFNCLKKDSWCCAYVGEKGLNGWPARNSINTTCCAIDDLTFTAKDPVLYAIATAPMKLTIQSTSTQPTSTRLSTISQATIGTEMDASSLPTGDRDPPFNSDASQSLPPGGLSTSAKIGLGVGVPLGVIALAAVGLLFWRQRRRRSASTNGVSELFVPNKSDKQALPPYQEMAMNQQGAAVYRLEAPSPRMVAELPVAENAVELPPQSKSDK